MAKRINLNNYAVPGEKLRWICSDDVFQFECTSDIEPLKEFIGQNRAIDSINFGLAVERSGYNLFLTGLTGTGKAATIQARLQKFLEEKASKGIQYQIYDWCYVYNFSAPDQPCILKLPQGFGKSFSNHMEDLLKKLREEIPKTFGSEEYTKRKQQIMEEHQRRYQETMDDLDREANAKNLMVQLSPMGAAVVPMVDGKVIPREEFLKFPESSFIQLHFKKDPIILEFASKHRILLMQKRTHFALGVGNQNPCCLPGAEELLAQTFHQRVNALPRFC